MKYKFLGFSMEPDISKGWSYNKSSKRDRYNLWNLGNLKEFSLHVSIIFMLIFLFLYSLFKDSSITKNSFTPMFFFAITFHLYFLIISLQPRIQNFSLDFLKPVDHRLIVKDFFSLYYQKYIRSLCIDFLLFYLFLRYLGPTITSGYALKLSLLFLSFMLVITSISLYLARNVFMIGIIFTLTTVITIMAITTMMNKPAATEFIVSNSLISSMLLLLMSLSISLLAYRKWQSIEWGAK